MTAEAEQREAMVERQIAARGIRDPRVLAAMRRVPRERFVEPPFVPYAYDDMPLPIAEGQTISQPYIVALMAEAAAIAPGDRVLEVGAGSGYAAAVLGDLAREVHTIERHAALAAAAAERLGQLGFENVAVHVGDGSGGWPAAAPYDAILAAAAAAAVPEPLLEQLAPGGRLVIPIGEPHGAQTLLRIRKLAPGQFEEEDLGPVAFVPLVRASTAG
jgi:protein-L-isoaspartate(D-aspartate) O-methyltransferase